MGSFKPYALMKTIIEKPPPNIRLSNAATGFLFLKKSAYIPGMNKPSAIISEASPRVLIIELNSNAINAARDPDIRVEIFEKSIIFFLFLKLKTSFTSVRAPIFIAESAVDIIAAPMLMNTRMLPDTGKLFFIIFEKKLLFNGNFLRHIDIKIINTYKVENAIIDIISPFFEDSFDFAEAILCQIMGEISQASVKDIVIKTLC